MTDEAPTRLPLPASASSDRLVRRIDPWVSGAVVVLVSVGIVMVYSASAVRALDESGSSASYLVRHLVAVGLGFLALAAALFVPIERWSRHAYLLLGLTLALLVMVFVPGLGRRVNGAMRWLAIGFQPGELAKLAIVVYLAHSLAKKRDKVETFAIGFLPHVIVTSLVVLLLLLQPDFGTSAIVFATMGMMLFVAGARIGYLAMGVLVALPIVLAYVRLRPHALDRLLVFLDPEAYRTNIGYQIWESLVSFGSGQIGGVGLGSGTQKLHYLPEAHTDFVFAILGEELGFVGVVLVIGAFAILVARGIHIALSTSSRLTMYLAIGIVSWIGLQAATNMAVVTSLLPTKGLTLPFVSYGGSSLLVTLLAIGVLLRISAEESLVRGEPA